MDTSRNFFFLLAAIVVGAFAALLLWTLVVKDQVTQTVTAAAQTNPLLSLFGNL